MAWRVLIGVSLTGMIALLLIAMIDAGDGRHRVMHSFLPIVFAVAFPALCSILASVLGPRLTRYFPFSQSLLFGSISVVAVAVVSAIVSVWDFAARAPCSADTLCGGPLDGMFWIVILFGIPAFLCASIGFGLSIWSLTRRGKMIFWPVWGLTLVVFTVGLLTRGP